MPYIKAVVKLNCQYCDSETIKFGKTGIRQRYRCKQCRKIQLAIYRKNAYEATTNAKRTARYNGLHSLLPVSGVFAAQCLSTGHEKQPLLAFARHSRA